MAGRFSVLWTTLALLLSFSQSAAAQFWEVRDTANSTFDFGSTQTGGALNDEPGFFRAANGGVLGPRVPIRLR